MVIKFKIIKKIRHALLFYFYFFVGMGVFESNIPPEPPVVVSLVLLVGVIVFAVTLLVVTVVVVIGGVVVVVVGGNDLWLLQRSSVQQDVSRSALSQTYKRTLRF